MLKIMKDKAYEQQRLIFQHIHYPELLLRHMLSDSEKEQVDEKAPAELKKVSPALRENAYLEWFTSTSPRAEMHLRVHRLDLLETVSTECTEKDSEKCRILMGHIKLFTQFLKNRESKQRANS